MTEKGDRMRTKLLESRGPELGGHTRRWGDSTLWGSRAILGQSSWARQICTSCCRKSEGVHGSRFISPHKTLITQKDHQLAAPPPHTHTFKRAFWKVFGPFGGRGGARICFLKGRVGLSQSVSPMSLLTYLPVASPRPQILGVWKGKFLGLSKT